ncbi:helix-turn-helix domain-containing protein [Bifidobacterium breve]|nr:helix-turn-helix transcriptional regulator [Bifidobacterium breve]WEB55799.1 helix-turn-helix transcriptional regulator [Bifidobacterium breve]
MKAHKVRQRQIAEYLGFTEAYVSERVNGKRAIDTNDVDALAALSGTTGRSLMIELARLTKETLRQPVSETASVVSQLEKVIGRKIEVEKAAYRDDNKRAESGRSEDLD